MDTTGNLDTRDALTQEYFNSAVEVDTGGKTFSLHGKNLTPEDFVGLTGAPDETVIKVQYISGLLQITAKNEDFFIDGEAQCSLVLGEDGQKSLLFDDYIGIRRELAPGLGLRLFAIQAFSAAYLGLSSIELMAAGSAESEKYNGYYTWARYGFDADLTADERATLPKTLGTSQRVADLMDTQEGRQWWYEHGSERYMEFVLKPDSRSWTTLLAVLDEKEVRL